jgi:hypothetical protein
LVTALSHKYLSTTHHIRTQRRHARTLLQTGRSLLKDRSSAYDDYWNKGGAFGVEGKVERCVQELGNEVKHPQCRIPF